MFFGQEAVSSQRPIPFLQIMAKLSRQSRSLKHIEIFQMKIMDMYIKMDTLTIETLSRFASSIDSSAVQNTSNSSASNEACVDNR